MSSGNNNINYNPYAILQVDPQSSREVVKKAYRALAKVYHPDRGGNTEMFRILTSAYRQIMGESDGQVRGVRDADLGVDQKGSLTADNFTLDKFNREFQSQSKKGVDYVYDIDYSGHKGDRKKSAYLAERNQVSGDLAKMKPIFNRGMGFDPNVFNKLFDRLKVEADSKSVGSGGEQGALVKSGGGGLPMALVSQSQIDFSNVNPHSNLEVSKSDLATGDLGGYSQVGAGGRANGDRHGVANFKNRADGLSREEYDRLMVEARRGIANSGPMSKAEVKNRMNEYKTGSYHQIPQGGAKPPVGAMMGGQVGMLDPYYRNSGTGLIEGRAGAGGGYMITYEDNSGGEMGKPSMPQVTYVQNGLLPQGDQYKTVNQLSRNSQIGRAQTRQNQYITPHPADAFQGTGGGRRMGDRMNSKAMSNRGSIRNIERDSAMGGRGRGMPMGGGGIGGQNRFMEPPKPSSSHLEGGRGSGWKREEGMGYPNYEQVMTETDMGNNKPISGGGIDLESQLKMAKMEAKLEEMTKRMKLQDKIIKKVYGRTKEFGQRLDEGSSH